jgi:hypothetical protein
VDFGGRRGAVRGRAGPRSATGRRQNGQGWSGRTVSG